ncbi:MAG: hypothetical protein QXV97_05315 [Candidatus Caldarchaeum sp.]
MGSCPRKEVCKPLGRVRRFFADVHRLASKNRGRKTEENFHTYSIDGENFSRVRRITDIPAEHGDELYVDTVPVELTDEFIEVLRRGVRVFYLRRLTLFNLMYERLGIKTKSAKNDVRVLMALETKWFREVDGGFLIMRRLVSDYRSLLKSYVSLTNRMKASSGVGKDILKDAVKSLEEKMTKMAEIIVSEAGKRIPAYSRVVEALGIGGDNHLMAREALAELMTYIDFTLGIRKIKDYLRLYKVDRKSGKPKIFNRHLRKTLQRLTMASKGGTGIKAEDEEQTIRRIREAVRREAGGHTGIDSREKPQAGMTKPLTCMGLTIPYMTMYLTYRPLSSLGVLRCCHAGCLQPNLPPIFPYLQFPLKTQTVYRKKGASGRLFINIED